VKETAAELEAIVAAISDRDAPLASRLCAEHVRNACNIALASLREAEDASRDTRPVSRRTVMPRS
jgi:DNA-binding GntR family transcriptional regulator